MANDEYDLKTAVELLDRLLEAADGGQNVTLDEYGASTLLAMLEDERYRVLAMFKFEAAEKPM